MSTLSSSRAIVVLEPRSCGNVSVAKLRATLLLSFRRSHSLSISPQPRHSTKSAHITSPSRHRDRAGHSLHCFEPMITRFRPRFAQSVCFPTVTSIFPPTYQPRFCEAGHFTRQQPRAGVS